MPCFGGASQVAFNSCSWHCAKTLIGHGLDVCETVGLGNTYLHIAAKRARPDICEFLLQVPKPSAMNNPPKQVSSEYSSSKF